MAASRKYPSTFCPSVVARELAQEWRPLMAQVRREAERLVAQSELECLQRGRKVAIENAVGPIRLRSAGGLEGSAR